MKISIIDSQKAVRLDHCRVKKMASAALAAVGEKGSELSIYVVDDAEIRRLNFRYRNSDRPTDVLAFSMREGQAMEGAEGILGDVVISTQTAARQARRYRKKIEEEIILYVIHGILHLAGYRDNTARARKKMEHMQEEIMGCLRSCQ